jgi:hypothetical protein
MDSFRFFALPPELRVMIYAYLGPPTIANTPDYCGLRQTCRLLRNEYDNEVLRTLRRAYQRANSGYSFTLFSLDLRSLEVRLQYASRFSLFQPNTVRLEAALESYNRVRTVRKQEN